MREEPLRRQVLDWIGEGVDSPWDDARFESLALALFRHQYAHGEAYRQLCTAAGATPESVQTWRAIPAVPTGAFKTARLACFPERETVRVFRSSGTTTDRRGEHAFSTLEVYEASLRATFAAHLVPESRPIRFCVLAPSGRDAPDSSLSHMFDVVVRELGTAASRFHVTAEGWKPDDVVDELAALDEPVAVVGTAFAFVHVLDHLESQARHLVLPAGSRAMETGGFKGRSRELSRAELHAAIATRLGIPETRIVNQYGMCELSSQFYESTLRNGTPSESKRVPPWVRTRALDPITLRDCAQGEWGALAHYDLANTGSVMAVQTSDEGRMLGPDRFEVRGRLPGAEARGCSIAADALLSGA